MGRNVIILDGGAEADNTRGALDVLRGLLRARGDRVEVVELRKARLAHCIGCFKCWVKTPGTCAVRDDATDIVRRVLASDDLVLFTPVSFGGYSSLLKRALDRIALPMLLPFFGSFLGEMHHPLRYSRSPRLLAVGIQQSPDDREPAVFRALVARNALNLHSPTHAAVVLQADAPDAATREALTAALDRDDPIPRKAELRKLTPVTDAGRLPPRDEPPGRALLIVGSPRGETSSSAMLGGHVMGRLRERGLQTADLVLRSSLRSEADQAALVDEARLADLIVLAFPLYVDALPTLATRALEVLWASRARWVRDGRPQQLCVICNSGFPEAHQNAVALAICERFASACGVRWRAGLALGTGEGIVGRRPLVGDRPRGAPPVGHVVEAFDLAAAALATGGDVPPRVDELLGRSPIPILPFAGWWWLVRWAASHGWKQMAAEAGVDPMALYDRPLDEAFARAS